MRIDYPRRGRIGWRRFIPSWRQWLGLRYRAFPAGARFIGLGRLSDWLELLDFEICEVRRYGVGFPWKRPF